MKRRLGRLVLAVFAVASINFASPKAQTVVNCPEYCKKAVLQAEYGDDWHIWYFINGCFLLPESCTGVGSEACQAQTKAAGFRTLRKAVR